MPKACDSLNIVITRADLGFSGGGADFQKTFEKFVDLFLGQTN